MTGFALYAALCEACGETTQLEEDIFVEDRGQANRVPEAKRLDGPRACEHCGQKLTILTNATSLPKCPACKKARLQREPVALLWD